MTGSIAHRTPVPPRITALAGIVALHVLIAYLLLTALVQRPAGEPPTPPIRATVETIQPRGPMPIPLQPDAVSTPSKPRQVSIPPPEFTPQANPDVARVQGTSVPPGPVASPPSADPIRVLGNNWLPNSAAYYPPDLIRNGVQGDAQVRACVDEAGRLAGAPALEHSSGNARLDHAALSIARDGRYARSVRGDVPVPNCYHFHITFRF
jgi:TonB family protein